MGVPMTRKTPRVILRGTKTRKGAGAARSRRKPKQLLSAWIAVRVKSNQERFARKHIERQGQKVFIPWILWEGDKREQPLFPGHIFVLGPQWYYLQTTPGVLAPIMMGDAPALMPMREMKALLKRCDREGVITIPKEPDEVFAPGQRIRGKKGPWQGQLGVYIRASNASRVRVLFNLLGGKYELELDHSEITASDVPDGALVK